VTEICHMALPAHALLAVKVRLKSVRNKRYFTHEAKTVFPTNVSSHRSGVTEIFHMALGTHALRAVQGRLKSVSNEGQFSFEGETLFRLHLPPPPAIFCKGVTGICHLAFPAHGL
jgi:hypothetical protein